MTMRPTPGGSQYPGGHEVLVVLSVIMWGAAVFCYAVGNNTGAVFNILTAIYLITWSRRV